MTLPPGQQLVAAGKWPTVGERAPLADERPWRVTVCGAVAEPRSYSLADLQNLLRTEQTVDIHCVTRWSKLGVRFSGVLLSTLLELSRPTSEARFVSFVARSERRHSTSLPLTEACTLETLIAFSADGEPLGEIRGGPIRVVVPHRYFYKSLKWLEEIELLSDDRLGHWEGAAGYHNTADPWLEQRYIAPGLSRAQVRAVLSSRDLAGLDLRSIQAAGRELNGLVASGALLRDADFRNCQLRAARFDGANLTNAHFAGADLREASFRDADLEGADFNGADLRGADFAGARLLAASFCITAQTDVTPARLDKQTRFDLAALDELVDEQQAFLRLAISRAAAD